MQAVILAAGEGKRLRPFTSVYPKTLIEILGQSILFRSIQSLLDSGIKEFIIITHYKEDLIKEHVEDNFPGLSVTFVHQSELKGTADAFLMAKDFIKGDYFFGINGDGLFSPSLLKRAIEATKSRKVVLGGKLVLDTYNYGIVSTDSSGKPKNIIEKPEKGTLKEGYANIGVYGLPYEIFSTLSEMERQGNISSRGELEFPDALNNLLASNSFDSTLITLESEEYWFDIGRPWEILKANEALLSYEKEERSGIIEPNVYIEGKVIIKEGARIRSGVYIEGPAFFDKGADIGPNCYIRKYSYFGKNSRVGNACEVKNSIIYDGTHAAHLSYIGDSILGPNCNFGAGTITANLRLDNRNIRVSIKGALEDSGSRKLGLICGSNVKTGIGALFMPGVKVGNNVWVGAGTIVNNDILDDTIFIGEQRGTFRRKKKNAD